MNNRYQGKESILSSIRNRIVNPHSSEVVINGQPLPNREVAFLLGELEIAQLELETQNDELYASTQLLETERAKFEQLFNFAPIGYLILDELGMIKELNQVAAELLGIPKPTSLTIHFQSLVAPEDLEEFYVFLHSLQINKSKQSRDVKLLLKNGAIYYTKIEGLQTQSIYDQQLHYYITVTDVTEMRQAQQNLLATTQRLEMTLRSSDTGTWSLDLETRKMYIDDFCSSLFEFHGLGFDGTLISFIGLIYPEDRERMRHSLLTLINLVSPINLEFRILYSNDEIKILSLKGKLVENDNFHKSYLGILADVTLQQSQAEQMRRIYKEKQRLILSTTFEAQERERQKISAALHDSVCQMLYGVKLQIQNFQKVNNLKNEFKSINVLIDQAVSETRRLSYDLTPSVLRDFGFTAGVKEIAQRLSTTHFKINTFVKKDANLLSSNMQLFVFRIMQELLNNCIKHSKANSAEIKVCTEGEIVSLVVSDNGIGFKENLEYSLTKGSGLRGIKNRLFLLEGTIKFDSSGNGTSVTVKVKKDLDFSSFDL